MDPDKKISFGFSKINKKTPVLQNKPVEKNKVELIECLEGQSIKIKDASEVVDAPLIIPVKSDQKDLFDRIKKVRGRESKKPTEPEDNRPDSELTIEELAARELINDAKNRLTNSDSSKNHLVLLPKGDEDAKEEEREPTLDDYERIPVNDFGMAMLRGMGWKEGMGIGKNPTKKAEAAKAPELRPKGLGLGASRIVQSEIPKKPACDKDGNTLVLKKGAYAKIIAGSHKGEYCEIQGLDDEAGRVIVKTSLLGKILTVNEFLIVVVTKEEYTKNSKVLNNEKYEEYKKISDKNLENYHKSRDLKDDIKRESSSSKLEDIKIKQSHSDSEGKEEKHHKKNGHRSKSRSRRSSSRSRESDDSRDRDRYRKEKDRSSKHREKNGHSSKSRSRRSRSRSKESDKYKRKSKR